nr:Chain S, TNEYKV PEPTIDE [synthetic construct]1V1T_T Chain T, TNEYKV PEPTIDE [synthetic construct]
TNEYKV